MALKKTKLVNLQTVTGVSTVGIFTAGMNSTPVGVASELGRRRQWRE